MLWVLGLPNPGAGDFIGAGQSQETVADSREAECKTGAGKTPWKSGSRSGGLKLSEPGTRLGLYGGKIALRCVEQCIDPSCSSADQRMVLSGAVRDLRMRRFTKLRSDRYGLGSA